MARIPLAPTGQVIARPGPLVHVDNNQAVGQAIEQLGAIGVAVADRAHHEQVVREHEQEQIRKAAERAQAQATVGGMRDQLDDAHDALAQDVLNGVVPKEDAEKVWGDRSKEIMEADGGLSSIKDQTLRTIAQTDVDQRSARLGNRLRRAVELRGRQDVSVALDQTLEHYSRQYNGDPEKSTAMAMSTVDQLAPFSDKPPAYWAAKKQAWKENTQYTAAFGMVNAAKSSPQLLDAAEKAFDRPQFADMDPQRRAVLSNQIDNFRATIAQKAEVAAARAERQHEHRLRLADSALNAFEKLTYSGVPSQQEFDKVNALTAGLPQNLAIRGLLEQARDVGALATMPLDRQRAELEALQRQKGANGTSQGLERRLSLVEKVVTQSERDYKEEPLRAANERIPGFNLKQLDFAGGLAGLAGQLQERVAQADLVEQITKRPESPLLGAEAQQLGHMLNVLAPLEWSNAIGMLADQIGPGKTQALAKQIDKSDHALSLAMKLGSAQTDAGLPAARLLRLGQQSLRDKGQKEGDQVPAKLREEVAKVVGDVVPGSVRQDVIEAAALIQLGKISDGQTATLRGSVEMALGGPIIEHAGHRLPAVAGMTVDRFRDAVAGPARQDVARQAADGKVFAAGQEVPLSAFLADLPMAELTPAGLGRYYVRAGAGVALNSKGQKIMIEVK